MVSAFLETSFSCEVLAASESLYQVAQSPTTTDPILRSALSNVFRRSGSRRPRELLLRSLRPSATGARSPGPALQTRRRGRLLLRQQETLRRSPRGEL